MMTTTKSLTDTQISSLRREAAMAGDYVQVAICDLALNGHFNADDYTTLSPAEARKVSKMTRDGAYEAIVEAINSAEAMA